MALRAGRRALTALEFQGLSAVPAEAEWFANIDNPRLDRRLAMERTRFQDEKLYLTGEHVEAMEALGVRD